MRPALLPGDRVLVAGRRLRAGNVAAVRDPRRPERVLVKRVASVDRRTGAVTVVGDNPAASTDSRHFGPVAPDLVVGRVRWRYLPRGRRGRLR
jgi:nickel-type superoxide dismutase maturation protease